MKYNWWVIIKDFLKCSVDLKTKLNPKVQVFYYEWNITQLAEAESRIEWGAELDHSGNGTSYSPKTHNPYWLCCLSVYITWNNLMFLLGIFLRFKEATFHSSITLHSLPFQLVILRYGHFYRKRSWSNWRENSVNSQLILHYYYEKSSRGVFQFVSFNSAEKCSEQKAIIESPVNLDSVFNILSTMSNALKKFTKTINSGRFCLTAFSWNCLTVKIMSVGDRPALEPYWLSGNIYFVRVFIRINMMVAIILLPTDRRVISWCFSQSLVCPFLLLVVTIIAHLKSCENLSFESRCCAASVVLFLISDLQVLKCLIKVNLRLVLSDS